MQYGKIVFNINDTIIIVIVSCYYELLVICLFIKLRILLYMVNN